MDRWRSDPEPELTREFFLEADHEFAPRYTVRVDARAPDADLASLFGWPVVASSRLTGSIRSAGVAAFDGDGRTAWTTDFGAAQGSSLTLGDVPTAIDTIEIDQPPDGASSIREIELRSGAGTRVVPISPDSAGRSRATVTPPLPPGPVEIVVTAIDAHTTIDRRFGDVVELPASISEIRFDGAPRVEPLGTTSTSIDCVSIAVLDGEDLTASITITGDGWLDGGAVKARPCRSTVRLGNGVHLLTDVDGVLQLDRVVLDDRLSTALASVDERPVVTELDRDRFGGRYEVAGCPTGCWFTFGEGFSAAWGASIDGADLGPPSLVDGGFNGWWVPPTETAFEVEIAWRAQRAQTIALVLSGLAALGCLVLSARGRKLEEPSSSTQVVPCASRPQLGRYPAAMTGFVWALVALLLVGPEGLLFGAVAGASIAITRRRDLPALVTIATVAAIGAYVVVGERRWMPLPNGGWPIQFERVHELGAFAVVSLLIAAVLADDATGDAAADFPTTDHPDTHTRTTDTPTTDHPDTHTRTTDTPTTDHPDTHTRTTDTPTTDHPDTHTRTTDHQAAEDRTTESRTTDGQTTDDPKAVEGGVTPLPSRP
jgi:hypothetical protein